MTKHASRLAALVVSLSILITGCASAPQTKQVAQNEKARQDIEKITRVEIFYHQPEYVVMDLGGSSASGMAGIFGVFGTLAGAAIDAGSKLTFKERAEARSKEFTALLKDSSTPDLTALQAGHLAELIKKSGREVTLTSVGRPGKETSMMDVASATGINTDPGTARLILRVTSGYTAESATASYRSTVITEFVLRDASGKRLVSMYMNKRDNGETYSTFDSLKSASKVAAESLNKDALQHADDVYRGTFDLPQIAAVAAR